MKKTLTTLFLALSAHFIIGQNVGINTPTPQTSLDVKGGIRNQPLYLPGSGTSIVIPDNQSNINLSGSFSSPFSANIAIPQDGQRLIIDNLSNQTGVLGGSVDIRKGLNEFVHSDGEWKAVNANAWGLNGNGNTDPATNFIGTTDKNDVVFKRYNDEKMRIREGGIEVANEILPNGVAGAVGQVLQSNGNGTMSWNDACEFKNYKVFQANSAYTAQNFTVPSGYKKIKIQAWGGGGMGEARNIDYANVFRSQNSVGGGGGGYIEGYLEIPTGTPISILVGNGAFVGASFSRVLSQNSVVSYSLTNFTAYGGGNGDITTLATYEYAGYGGGFSSNANAYKGVNGENGKLSTKSFSNVGGADYVTINGAAGGDAGNSNNTHGNGYISVVATLSLGAGLSFQEGRSNGKIPGGGSGIKNGSTIGGDGLVIISW